MRTEKRQTYPAECKREAVRLVTAKGETGGEFPDSPHAYAKRGDNSCWKIVDPDGAFFAWTRGRYYFSAHAKGGERDLEEFVKGFPC